MSNKLDKKKKKIKTQGKKYIYIYKICIRYNRQKVVRGIRIVREEKDRKESRGGQVGERVGEEKSSFYRLSQ